MEAPSPKRRKLSPVPSATIEARYGPSRSPSTKNPRPGWPSYLSPTKASLARSYPHLLASKSTSPKKRSPLRQAISKPPRWTPPEGNGDESPRLGTAMFQEDQFWTSASPVGKPTTTWKSNALSPKRRTKQLASPGKGLQQGLRASPPEAAEFAPESTHADTANPDALSEDHHITTSNTFENAEIPTTPSKPSRHSPEYTSDGEPRLPSTPLQLGLEPPLHPPSGLSPSSTPRKPPSRLTSLPTSSPLKPRRRRRRTTTVQEFEDRCNGIAPLSPSTETETMSGRVCWVNVPSPDTSLCVELCLYYPDEGTEVQYVRVSEVSGWADGELRLCLEGLAPRRDLPGIRGLVERYWYFADERARCWAECERDLGVLVPPSNNVDVDVDELSQSIEPADDALHAFRGRQHFVAHHDGVSLMIRWEIVPDPGCEGWLWRKFETSLSFDGENLELAPETKEAGEAFQALVEGGKDYAEAIKILVGAVFGDVLRER